MHSLHSFGRIVGRIVIFILLGAIAQPAKAKTLTWDGGTLADPTAWSRSGNWIPAGVPADGDDLIFPGGAQMTTSVNDLINLHVHAMTFIGSGGSTLNGNGIYLDSAITCNHTVGRARVNFDLTFSTSAVTFYTLSDGYLDIEQNIFLGNNDLLLYPFYTNSYGTNIEIHGVITGSGGLTKLGDGSVNLLGVYPNDYTGTTRVQQGTLHLTKSGVAAISSKLELGFNSSGAPALIDHGADQYPGGISVSISNAFWVLTDTATVTNLTLAHATIYGAGVVNLLSDVTVLHGYSGYADESDINCSLYLGNQSRTFYIDSQGAFTTLTLKISGPIIGLNLGDGSPGIIKDGNGALFLQSVNTYYGPTVIKDGELHAKVPGALGSYAEAEAYTSVEGGDLFLYDQTLNERVIVSQRTASIVFQGMISFNGTLTLSNYVDLIGYDDSSSLQISNSISGPASFAIFGGTVRLAGSSANTFGTVNSQVDVIPGGTAYYSSSAILELAKANNLVAVPGRVHVESVDIEQGQLRNLQNGGVSDVILDNSAWYLNGNTVAPTSLTLGGSCSVDTGGGQLQLNYTGTNRLHLIAGGYISQIFGTVNCVGATDDITVDGASSLIISGQIIGGGALRKLGAGRLGVSGLGDDTYAGGTFVNEGTLELRKPNGTITVPGNLTIGPITTNSLAVARAFQNGALPTSATVTVNGNALYDLNGNNQTLTRLNLNDGGDAQTGAGLLTFAAGGVVAVDTLNPGTGLFANSALSGNIGTPYLDYITFTVATYANPFVSTQPELDVPANISGFGGIIKNGNGQLRLSGNNTFDAAPPFLSGDVNIYAGTLIATSSTALGGTNGVTSVGHDGTLALDGGVFISNEPLYLSSANNPALQSRSGTNTWSNNNIQLTQDTIMSVDSGGSLVLSSSIAGTGALVKTGLGALTLSGSSSNTYSGDTYAAEGTLVLDKTVATITTIPHHIFVGIGTPGNSATLVQRDNRCINGSVTVNDASSWILDHVAEDFKDSELQGHVPLTLNGNAHVQGIANAILDMPPGGGITVNPGSNTTATISVLIGLGSVLAGPTSHPIDVSASFQSGPDLIISNNISSLFGDPGLQKEGLGTLMLLGTNTYTGTNLVNAGTLWVNGVQPQSPVHLNSGTRLKGSGTVGDINLIGNVATISPGASPGILTCSNFNTLGAGNGTLEIELNGKMPGTGYDQLNVRGGVRLTGLSLSHSLGFPSTVGGQFTLINNDGVDAVTNTFTGLPQNAKLYVGNQLFQISYSGASGNDVVLTRLVTPPPPLLAINQFTSNAVHLTWATNDPPFYLNYTTNLIASVWSSNLPSSVIVGTNSVVTESISNSMRFYRLTSAP